MSAMRSIPVIHQRIILFLGTKRLKFSVTGKSFLNQICVQVVVEIRVGLHGTVTLQQIMRVFSL